MLSSVYQTSNEYLFSRIGKEILDKERQGEHVIRLSMGDVTCPLAPCVVESMCKAASELGEYATFRGYPPSNGYRFVREKIAALYGDRIGPNDVFVSDGAKSDLAGWCGLFDLSVPAMIPNPSYPAYLGANVLRGRRVVEIPCAKSDGYQPLPPKHKERALIYLCSPSNPIGVALSQETMTKWVEYAIETKSLILFDSAYREFNHKAPKSIYEVDKALSVAVEIGSLSKSASFGGVRFGWSIVPGEIVVDGVSLRSAWERRQSTMFNGVSYVTQRGAESALSEEGRAYSEICIEKYIRSAEILANSIKDTTELIYGDSPYVWAMIDEDGWSFFDRLLAKGVAVTPGIGFGTEGARYVRLSGFAGREDILKSAAILPNLWHKK